MDSLRISDPEVHGLEGNGFKLIQGSQYLQDARIDRKRFDGFAVLPCFLYVASLIKGRLIIQTVNDGPGKFVETFDLWIDDRIAIANKALDYLPKLGIEVQLG